MGIALLTADGRIRIGVRLETNDADAPHAVLTAAGATVHRMCFEFAPPMFTFADSDDNLLVLIEEQPR